MQAELQYKKREKTVAPTGWEAFNQKALYEAYEKRTSDIPYTQEVLTCTAASRHMHLLILVALMLPVVCIPLPLKFVCILFI